MEVSAEEYMNWGRTRLRVELKKRGLSPSGLKTELLARLEEYFKRQRPASGGAPLTRQQQTTYGPNNNNTSHSTPATSSQSSSLGHPLPKQHHSKQLLELYQQHNNQQQNEAASLGRAAPRKRPRKSQTPRRGLQPQGSADNTSSEGEGSDYGSSHANELGGSPPSYSTNKRPRLGLQDQQHESDDCSNASEVAPTRPATQLSGRSFKKESGQLHAPHAEVRSVETIAFGKGDKFHFTHRFWRGKLLRRRFDFYGTYTIVPSSAGEGLHLDDLAALSCAFAEGEKSGAAEESLKDLTEGKIILHWPSKLDAPELRDWQFDKSYSYLFFAATPLPTSPTCSDASLQPGSTSPMLASVDSGSPSKRPHFLYTKHSAVFVEDTC